MIAGNLIVRAELDSLFALPMSPAAWQRHLNHTRCEGHEEWVTLAVDLHADDAPVIHAVNAAPCLKKSSKKRNQHYFFIYIKG